MEMEMILLRDIGIIIVAATFLGFIAKSLKQPLIPAYVLAGIVVGPFGLGLVTEKTIIDTLAQLGIALLLFMVGLELDIKRLKNVGKVSVGCGLGQIIITFIFGYILAVYLGFTSPPLAPFYIAFALTISSTMVVIKLLSDENELGTLHGKIILGTLLVQDAVTIMVLAALPTLKDFTPSILTASMITGIGLISIAMISSRFILPLFIRFAAKSIELLFLFAISWCFLFSLFTYLVFLHLLGFEIPPIAIGSFLAGISLASFPYNIEIVGRIKSLKDFFATLFFASLGMKVTIGAHGLQFIDIPTFLDSVTNLLITLIKNPLTKDIIILSLFVLFGTALIMFITATLFGYRKRTSFLTAISLAQISEFSLILVMEGETLGHIGEEIFSLVTWIALITITVSSYFITHKRGMYSRLLPILSIFDRISTDKELESIPETSEKHIIVFGCHRMGSKITNTLKRIRADFLVVDYDPDVIKQLMEQRIPCIYGDMGDAEILEKIGLGNARIVVSTIPDQGANLLLIYETKKRNPETLIFITANYLDQALELYNAGADYVILPKMISGDRISSLVKTCIEDKGKIKKVRKDHIFKLEDVEREELLWRYEPSFLKSLEKKFGGRRKI
ncbi:MAG: cation:proton antiporter [Candidatus Altiarchaeota archaeon]|nr:cation:proton antiporter [Candidatus Altiarchaeota archaeon]